MHPEPPRIVSSKYRLLRLLGEGGAGSVWEAENILVGRHVAIKILHANVAAHEATRQRFLAEARLSARLAHPNVVDVFDLGMTEEGTPYIVMELLDGETLESIIERRGRVPAPYACEIMYQVLGTLVAAHALQIVHRDLKPANIMLVHPRPDRPIAKVLDFGVAQGMQGESVTASEVGLVFGTPEYMAPEQARGDRVDERCDIYAAGAILYEMLAGSPPIFGESAAIVLSRVLTFAPVPIRTLAPETPPQLADAITSAIAKNPAERPTSAREFLALIRPFVSRTPSTLPAGLTEAPLPLRTSKKRALAPQRRSGAAPAAPLAPRAGKRRPELLLQSLPPSQAPRGHGGPKR